MKHKLVKIRPTRSGYYTGKRYSLVLCHNVNMLITTGIIDTGGTNINTFNEVTDFFPYKCSYTLYIVSISLMMYVFSLELA